MVIFFSDSLYFVLAAETRLPVVFIECTATDLTKAKIVLNTMLTMFAQYCSTPHVVEKVLVHEPSSASAVAYPDYTYFDISADITYINKAVGINIAGAEMATLLDRMSLIAELSGDGKSINVKIPPTRSDILHAADVMEDVAVAYGFNNVRFCSFLVVLRVCIFLHNRSNIHSPRRPLSARSYPSINSLICCVARSPSQVSRRFSPLHWYRNQKKKWFFFSLPFCSNLCLSSARSTKISSGSTRWMMARPP